MKNEKLFSPIEIKVLDLLGTRKKSIGQLADMYFLTSRKGPINPNATVSQAVLRINRKCEYHKLKWFLNSEGLGRGGKTIWRSTR